MAKETKEIQEEMALLDKKHEIEVKRHEFVMAEVEAKRKLCQLEHDNALEVIRIKSAEIRKSQERRRWVE